jgi:hypothetical protein
MRSSAWESMLGAELTTILQGIYTFLEKPLRQPLLEQLYHCLEAGANWQEHRVLSCTRLDLGFLPKQRSFS